jgi:hypothetical protein
MTGKGRKNSKVGLALSTERTVLKPYEASDQDFTFLQCVQPTLKFGQVLFLYRASNLGAGDLKTELDNSSTIAVIA